MIDANGGRSPHSTPSAADSRTPMDEGALVFRHRRVQEFGLETSSIKTGERSSFANRSSPRDQRHPGQSPPLND